MGRFRRFAFAACKTEDNQWDYFIGPSLANIENLTNGWEWFGSFFSANSYKDHKEVLEVHVKNLEIHSINSILKAAKDRVMRDGRAHFIVSDKKAR